MDYPNDFDTPAFPAGKSIAWSRVVAIKISIIFFLIVCLCGLFLFLVHSKRNFPFLISVDPLTDNWLVIAYPKKNNEKSIETYQIIQEKLVNDFVTNWFTISNNQSENLSRWKKCDSEDCSLPEQFNPQNIDCALFCAASPDLFQQFSTKVLREYNDRIIQAKETWTIVKKDIRPHYVAQNSSAWQVYIEIYSNINGKFNVLAFVDVNRSQDEYPTTLGYYIEKFNSYRIQQ